jgi:hypothetical protein
MDADRRVPARGADPDAQGERAPAFLGWYRLSRSSTAAACFHHVRGVKRDATRSFCHPGRCTVKAIHHRRPFRQR